MLLVIPARLASTRLSNKLLLEIAGKPLLQHTWLQAKKSSASRVIIATDSDEISLACESFGAEVCMTDSAHTSGTDRVAEVIKKLKIDPDTIVVNLQGDEPLMPAEYIDLVGSSLTANSEAVMATLSTKILNKDDLHNPNVVKLVSDSLNHALYFSRSVLPYSRDSNVDFVYQRHLGLYSYRASFLHKYSSLDSSIIEQVESLEQLRVLWYGFKIKVAEVKEMPGLGVDTLEDFLKVKKTLET